MKRQRKPDESILPPAKRRRIDEDAATAMEMATSMRRYADDPVGMELDDYVKRGYPYAEEVMHLHNAWRTGRALLKAHHPTPLHLPCVLRGEGGRTCRLKHACPAKAGHLGHDDDVLVCITHAPPLVHICRHGFCERRPTGDGSQACPLTGRVTGDVYVPKRFEEVSVKGVKVSRAISRRPTKKGGGGDVRGLPSLRYMVYGSGRRELPTDDIRRGLLRCRGRPVIRIQDLKDTVQHILATYRSWAREGIKRCRTSAPTRRKKKKKKPKDPQPSQPSSGVLLKRRAKTHRRRRVKGSSGAAPVAPTAAVSTINSLQ